MSMEQAYGATWCKSCGVALVDHMGHQGQCAELQRVKAANAELMVVCAWLNSDLSEGQVSKFLGHDRVECRRMKELFVADGIGLVDAKARGEQ